MTYIVEISLFGRKHRTRVKADSADMAKQVVLDALVKKVRFTEVTKEGDDVVDFLGGIFFGKQNSDG